MNTSLRKVTRKTVLAAVVSAAVLFPATAGGWWGPAGPYTGAWDPREAYLDEYGLLDRYGPTRSDIRRMHRDNMKAMWGYPVRRSGLGPYGPTLGDIRRQQHRKARRYRGYYW